MWKETLKKWIPLLALYLLWPALALVAWGELKPKPSEIEREFWDKALHFTAYFGLAGMVCLALKADRRVLWATLGLVLMGGFFEIMQGFTGRDPSFFDELANTLGAFCGAGTGWLVFLLLGVLSPKGRN
jgi:VanZ family protein